MGRKGFFDRPMGVALSLLLLALALGGCDDVIRGAPPEATISVNINPTFIAAHGGVSVVTAYVTEKAGTPVSDGTVVEFFTTLGRIDSQVKTKNGRASANLVADSRSGKAKISVFSGGISPEASSCSSDCEVTIGSALPMRVVLVADPPSLGLDRTSYLTANVFDESGNPVANVPVIFEITDGPKESLASGSRTAYTDSSGQVFDVLSSRERYSSSATKTRAVKVQATAANGKSSPTVTVTVTNIPD